MSDALISIKPRFVDQIVSGVKTVEIRRRRMNMPAGTHLWIYSTKPAACVRAVARVRDTVTDLPSNLWQLIANASSVSKSDYLAYVAGSPSVTAIFLEHVEELDPVLELAKIRTKIPDFHPPQSFLWLQPGSKLSKLLEDTSRRIIEPSNYRQ